MLMLIFRKHEKVSFCKYFSLRNIFEQHFQVQQQNFLQLEEVKGEGGGKKNQRVGHQMWFCTLNKYVEMGATQLTMCANIGRQIEGGWVH